MPINRKIFFDHVRTDLFGGSLSGSQVAGMSSDLDCFEAAGLTDPRWLANILAQEYHETGKAMVGVKEWGQGKGMSYGVPAGPYGHVYFGRGKVQLTWLKNYEDATPKLRKLGLDVDLVKDPDAALRNDVGSAIIVHGMAEGWFTGHGLGIYFNDHADNPVDARRIVNGLDRAQEISGYHAKFLAAIKAATKATPELDAIRGAIAKAAVEQAKPPIAASASVPTLAPAHIDASRASPLTLWQRIAAAFGRRTAS